MNLFNFLFDDDWPSHTLESSINPASGLPMIGDSSFDIEGNVFGTDSSGFDSPSISSFDSGCSFDFGFGIGCGTGCGIGSMFDD